MSKTKMMIGASRSWLWSGSSRPAMSRGTLMTETRTVALEGAARAEVGMRMGAGELRLRERGPDRSARRLEFEFNRERLRPEVDYRVLGDKGLLQVRHGRHRGVNFGTTRNRWDLDLGPGRPHRPRRRPRRGTRARSTSAASTLQRVEIDMGVGEMSLDLRGPHAAELLRSRSTAASAAASWTCPPRSASGSRSTAGSARSTSTASGRRAAPTSTTPTAGAR
ncbi:MAG: toast rack family protein [Ignavibacteriales bacterium]|nr:toast rack family protein [Ignavibacteriales bacterium]